MYNPNNIKNTVALGIQGENKATVVKFDVTDWIEEFPYANFNILVKRPNETVPYIANTILHDKSLIWVITQSDTAIKGLGKAELRAIQGDVVKKSITFATQIIPSLEGTPTPTPPEPAQSWVNEVLEKGNEILQAEARQFYINENGHLIEVDFAGNETDLGNVVGGGSGASTIVKVDGISIMVENIANIHTTGNYSSNNPLVTEQFATDYTDTAISEHNEDETSHTDIRQAVSDIEDLIPQQATSDNQLADKQFVNSSVATNTAIFRGTFNSIEELPTTGITNNDYAFVISTDEFGTAVYNRYKYVLSTSQWVYEYSLNNSSFTANQWATINSGLTAEERGQILNDILNLQDTKQDKITSSSKLNADLVDDSSATNKFVTAQDKSNWNGKQNAISDLATIRQNSSLGATALQQSKVKSAQSTTSGDVYDVTYINAVVGDVETILADINSGGGVE
ncbi:MAG: hypothetical protein KBS62_03150 [Oscillospiraceae bacterium]|nr:hypothetical protein [Candidatus Ruminococcus equi]